MKVKFLVKIVALCLSLAVLVSTPGLAYAQETESTAINPRFTYITFYTVNLSINNGNAHITANLDGNPDVTESYIKCNLEKLMGSYWMQMKSFSTTDNDQSAVLIADYGVDAGTYRVMAIFRCNTETQTCYSGNVTY